MKEFEGQLDKEEVDVEVLNQEVRDTTVRSRRRSPEVYRITKENQSQLDR